MKKISFLLVMALVSMLSLANLAFAEKDANWWGRYCKEDESLCIMINNVSQNKMGIFNFSYLFTNGRGKDLADGVAMVNEGEEIGREANVYYLKLVLSSDNDSIMIGQYPGTKIEESDGITEGMFGTYVRKND